MKNTASHKRGLILLLVLLLCLCGPEMFAQPGPPVPPGGGEQPPTPINALVIIALVTGAFFGMRKLRK